MILGFLFFIQTFLKSCKALRTEKYKRYINIFIIIYYQSTDSYVVLQIIYCRKGNNHLISGINDGTFNTNLPGPCCSKDGQRYLLHKSLSTG